MAHIVFRRSAFLVAGRAIGDVLQLVLYIAIVRTFSEAEVGDYAFAFAVALLAGSVIGLGARSLVTREVRNHPDLGAAYPVNLTLIHGVLTVVMAGGILLWAAVAAFSAFLTVLCLLALVAAGLNAVAFSAIGIIDASGRVEHGAIAEVVGRIGIFALGFSALVGGLSLPFIMGAQIAGAAFYLGVAIYLAHKSFGPLATRADVTLVRRTLRLSVPFLMAAVLYALYARIDIVMLHSMAGAEDTAHYAVAFRIIETSFVIGSMVGIAMFPELVAGGPKGGEERRRLFQTTSRWLAVVGGLVSVGLLIAGDQVATLVFGPDMAFAGTLLQLMGFLVVIAYIKEPFWRLLVAQGREKLQMYIQGTGVLLNIALNLVLIPRFGAYGAVAASLISESLMLCGFVLAVVGQKLLRPTAIAAWFAALTPACLVGLWLRDFMPPLAAGALACSLLLALFVLVRLVSTLEILGIVHAAAFKLNLRRRGRAPR